MRAYYERRAREYDDWWLSTGLFARRHRPGWTAEVEQLIQVINALDPAHVLDVACGTGFLTRHLQGNVVAIDQSETMAAIAAERLPGRQVLQADAAPLPFRPGAFDRVFTSHFYGHLLREEREVFLAEAGRVGSQLVVVDSAFREDVEPEAWQERALNDGSRHEVYKRYFTDEKLAAELGGGYVLHHGDWFVAVATAR